MSDPVRLDVAIGDVAEMLGMPVPGQNATQETPAGPGGLSGTPGVWAASVGDVCGDHVVIQFGYRPRFEDWDGRVDEGRAITVVCERRPHRKGDHRRGKVRWTRPGGTKVWLR